MSLALHQVCLPPLRQTLESINDVLGIAAAHYEKNGLDEASLVQSRLAPDMFTLAEQVQTMTDHAGKVVALLADVADPTEPRSETTLAALQGRIAHTRAFIEGVDTRALDAGEKRHLSVSNRVGVLDMEGAEYLLRIAFPHFFFHATTAYDLVRQAGVEVGKRHFLGSVFRERLTPHAKAS
jgi:hypothetical protein